ncbi:MAG TPA: hypothetical protein VFX50_01620 [Gemmatimonadales bacterium]|nr:hypothetical protein [Gemmatimonadales bacterium]
MKETFRIEALAQELCRRDGEHWADLDESGRDFWRERARAELSRRSAPEWTPDPPR